MSKVWNQLVIENILNELSLKRPVFCSEADFQFEFAYMIRKYLTKENVDFRILLEYFQKYEDNNSMYIDILVIFDDLWYPIELKYKTKGNNSKKVYAKYIDGKDEFILKNHSAHNDNCERYQKDILRIENIKENKKEVFGMGYVIMLTNDCYYFNHIDRNNWKNYSELSPGKILDCKNKNAVSRFKYLIKEIK